MFTLDLVHRHVAGALDHHLHAVLPGDLGELAERVRVRRIARSSLASAIEPGRKPVAQREGDVIGRFMISQISSKVV